MCWTTLITIFNHMQPKDHGWTYLQLDLQISDRSALLCVASCLLSPEDGWTFAPNQPDLGRVPSLQLPSLLLFDPRRWRKKGRKGQGEVALTEQGGIPGAGLRDRIGVSRFSAFGLLLCTCVWTCTFKNQQQRKRKELQGGMGLSVTHCQEQHGSRTHDST